MADALRHLPIPVAQRQAGGSVVAGGVGAVLPTRRSTEAQEDGPGLANVHLPVVDHRAPRQPRAAGHALRECRQDRGEEDQQGRRDGRKASMQTRSWCA